MDETGPAVQRRRVLATLSLAATGGCTIGGTPPEEDELSLSAPAFEDGRIPVRFTCDGGAISPPLVVEGLPSGTESVAIFAEWLRGYSPGTTWLLWNLPPDDPLDVPAGIPKVPRPETPAGAVQGTNDGGFVGYRSPCHETPGQNDYRFAVLALTSPPDLEPGAGRDAFDDAVAGSVRSSTSIQAVYDRF